MVAYVLFWLLDPPHERVNTQQTPNEEAQDPEAAPFRDSHWEEV